MPKSSVFTGKHSRPSGFSLLFILLLSACQNLPEQQSALLPSESPDANYWRPSPDERLQIQYADYPPDSFVQADIFAVDLFEIPLESIENLHRTGKRVICYVNTGAWEDYRPDAGNFPVEIIGRDYEGWEGEKWLDISRYSLFKDVMESRFNLAVSKGCDGIDADNMQNYQEKTGFSISEEDQLSYNIWLSGQAHERGLSIGLKNNAEQAGDLEPYFEWSLIEDCAVYGWCEMLSPFVKAGKPVYQVEYSDEYSSPDEFCSRAIRNGYTGLFKNRNLDARVEFCN